MKSYLNSFFFLWGSLAGSYKKLNRLINKKNPHSLKVGRVDVLIFAVVYAKRFSCR